ncbi:MAG: trypsin-like peptidase domain-containing protein [Phycisphaerales bacterium]|nr:MAG: trypsin-like peptidase domain-containing protein [Phycisphaerales bacterium]
MKGTIVLSLIASVVVGAALLDLAAAADHARTEHTPRGRTKDVLIEKSVRGTQPDLVVTSCLAWCDPSVPGSLYVDFDVCNYGSSSAGYHESGIYASADAIVSVSDTLVCYASSYGLAAGTCENYSGWCDTSWVPPGTYYIGFYADDMFMVTESDEANNTCVSGQEGLPCDSNCAQDFTVTPPGTWSGNTCGAGNECGLFSSEEHVYEVTLLEERLWTFSLCDSWYDTILLVGTVPGGGDVCYNDDSCGLQSECAAYLSAGTYYVTIEGYGGDCGDYVFEIPDCPPPPAPTNPQPPDGGVQTALDTDLCWNGGTLAKTFAIPKVIYGPDDRLDEYEVTDPAILAAGDATVALVDIGDLTDNGNGTYSLPTETYAEWYLAMFGRPLCPDERFRDQPNPADCSGFLVAPDVVATAGHCISSAYCATTAFVFGFVMTDATTPVLTIPASEVYYCGEVIARQESAADWGLIRLDRAVAGHNPLQIRCSGKVPDNEPLLAVGHPVGLPRKYAGGATVRDNTPNEYFQANLDTYVGNSGSAVFSATTLEVEGILVRGNYDWFEDGSCDRSNVCSDSGCPSWEDVTRATQFCPLIPSYDVYFGACGSMQFLGTTADTCWSLPQLDSGTTYCWKIVARDGCGETDGPVWSFTTEGVCGNGTCDPDEDPCNCPQDCSSPGSCCTGSDCDDADLCTTDTCVSFVCAYDPVDCSHLDIDCDVGVCNPGTGACETQPANDGLPCDDGDVCNTGETCQAGTCTGGSAVDCSVVGTFCADYECGANGSEGNCDVMTPRNEGLTCDDSVCSSGNTCQSGDCTGGTVVNCNALDTFCADYECDPGASSPNCDAVTLMNEGLPCDDGGLCTENDVCSAGVCGGTAVADGTSCSDGLFCNGEETCLSGSCLAGNDPCLNQSCDEQNDVCFTPPACTSDADCDNGLYCDGVEKCSGGLCVAGAEVCPDQMCDEDSDVCVDCLTDADCDDELFCNGIERCENGTCMQGTDPCPGQLCDDTFSDACVDCKTAGDCEDGDPCTRDVCVLGECDRSAVECPVGQSCDPDTGQCMDCLTDADCDDENPCTVDECIEGMCWKTDVECPEGERCDPDTGECVADTELPVPQCIPALCDDGDPCTIEECVDTDGDAVEECINRPVQCLEGEECDPDSGECVPEKAKTGRGTTRGGCGLFSSLGFVTLPLYMLVWVGIRSRARRRA